MAVAATLSMTHSKRRMFSVVAIALALALTTGIAVAQPAPSTADRQGLLRTGRALIAAGPRSFSVSRPPWIDTERSSRLPHYPLMADPRRWPGLFANTTEGTLSLNPITRRHWWQG